MHLALSGVRRRAVTRRAQGGRAARRGVHRPFQRENESWAELVVRTGRAIIDIAYRHAGETVVLVGHSETVNSSFHVLGMQPLLRAFDTEVAPGSLTEWTTDGDPASPPTRWTLRRFSA
ncbi:histidine phosphatase family protein [Catellatospora coxensis]